MNTRLWLTVTLTLSVLSLSAGQTTAQPKPAEKSQSKTATPNPMKITGKVIEVDEKGKTIKVMSKGKEITLNAAKLKQLPKVGEVHDITYTQAGAGAPEVLTTSMNSSRSNIN